MNWSMFTANRTTSWAWTVGRRHRDLARELNLGTDIMTARDPIMIKAGRP